MRPSGLLIRKSSCCGAVRSLSRNIQPVEWPIGGLGTSVHRDIRTGRSASYNTLRGSDEKHVSFAGKALDRSYRLFFFVDAVHEVGFRSEARSSFRPLMPLPFRCSTH